MPGSMTNYLELKLLDHATARASFTVPASCNLGLISALTDPEAGTVTELAVANGYARQAVVAQTAASGQIQLPTVQKVFTASGADWATVVGIGLWDASSAGNLLFWSSVTPTTVLNGETMTFAINSITITLD